MGPIPAGSTLIFETEIIGIKGVPKPETIVTKSTSSTSSDASESTEEATAGIADNIASAASVAAKVAETVLVDSDDVQEHNEL
jgi:FK506-binding protein 2